MPPATRKPPRITLGDLSPEDRRALLEEAREASRRNPVDVDGYMDLTPREQAIRALMDARDHVRGCPVADGELLGRVEGYDSRRPPNPATGSPEAYLGVIRCAECGGSTVLDARLEAAVADKSRELAEAELEPEPTE